jgi:hypothetical protein
MPDPIEVRSLRILVEALDMATPPLPPVAGEVQVEDEPRVVTSTKPGRTLGLDKCPNYSPNV